jgi:CHAT domain-containing protein
VLLVGLGGDGLPEVDAEIEALSRLVPRARVLSGADATVARLRRAIVDVDWLHLAGHGHADADRPILSGVRLADRWAHIPDFAPAGRAPRVVVLAACRTGELVAGYRNQWQGLPGGLMRAGSQAVLASLWEVEDAPARALSVALMKALLEGHPLGRALQNARAATLTDPVQSWNAWTWGLFGRLDARFPGPSAAPGADGRARTQGQRLCAVVDSSDAL